MEIADASLSTLTGRHDTLNSFAMLADSDPATPAKPPFKVWIAAGQVGRC